MQWKPQNADTLRYSFSVNFNLWERFYQLKSYQHRHGGRAETKTCLTSTRHRVNTRLPMSSSSKPCGTPPLIDLLIVILHFTITRCYRHPRKALIRLIFNILLPSRPPLMLVFHMQSVLTDVGEQTPIKHINALMALRVFQMEAP